MFLDTLETPKGSWLQTCVSLPYAGVAPGYAETLSTIMGSFGAVPSLNVALRIGMSAESGLKRAVILSAPSASERPFRRFAASFSRLELAMPGSVELAADAASFDAAVGQFPAQHCRAVASGLRRGGVWFGAGFRLISVLGHLLEEARVQGFALFYQMNMCPFSADAEVRRAVERNYLAARDLPGVRPPLLALQRRLADRVASACCLVEEFAGVDGDGGREWLKSALDRAFLAENAAFGFQSPVFPFEDFSEILSGCLHSSIELPPSPDEVCVTATDAAEIAAIVSWQPDALLAQSLVSAAPPASAEPAPLRLQGPAPYEGSEPYIFISYRRTDLPALLPAFEELRTAGIHYWYDNGIKGGTEWLQVLEERLEKAEMVVVFLSQAAVDSKYVRRELIMADGLNKPILTLLTGNLELRYGLKLLLRQYQMVDMRAQPVSAAVKEALSAAGK